MCPKKNYKLTSVSTIKLQPCCLEYSTNFNVFIIGTYQLIEKDSELIRSGQFSSETLKRLNNRIGSLNIYSDQNKLVHEHRCNSGGVFDFKMSKLKINSKHVVIDLILVAHSNGFVALYNFDGIQISLLQEFDTLAKCQMLTTIDDNFEPAQSIWTIFAGTADGQLFGFEHPMNSDKDETSIRTCLLSSQKPLVRSVTNNSLEIWFLKMIQIRSTRMIVVCSEDACWRLFKLSHGDIIQMYVNKEFDAGVTSVEYYFETKKFQDNKNGDVSFHLLIGSYDSALRIYKCDLNYSEDSNPYVNCVLTKKIHIQDSGIWRIKSHGSIILLSAMYSGAWILRLNNYSEGKYSLCRIHDVGKDASQEKDSEKNLIYDVAINENHSKILMSSFYKKENYLYIEFPG